MHLNLTLFDENSVSFYQYKGFILSRKILPIQVLRKINNRSILVVAKILKFLPTF